MHEKTAVEFRQEMLKAIAPVMLTGLVEARSQDKKVVLALEVARWADAFTDAHIAFEAARLESVTKEQVLKYVSAIDDAPAKVQETFSRILEKLGRNSLNVIEAYLVGNLPISTCAELTILLRGLDIQP